MAVIPNDPFFSEQAVLSRIKNLWLQLLTCRAAWDPEPLKPYFSDMLYQKELEALEKDRAAGQVRRSERPAVLDGTLDAQVPSQGREILVCHLFTRFIPRIVDHDSGKIRMEGRESFFHEDWVLTRPEGTKTPQPGAAFSVNCPNCGAPFSLYKSAKCPMCRSLIPVPDFSWTVSEISGRVG